MGAVIQATLLPAEAAGDAPGATTLLTTNTTYATHAAQCCRTGTTALCIALTTAATANTGSYNAVSVGIALAGVAVPGGTISSAAITVCTGRTVPRSRLA